MYRFLSSSIYRYCRVVSLIVNGTKYAKRIHSVRAVCVDVLPCLKEPKRSQQRYADRLDGIRSLVNRPPNNDFVSTPTAGEILTSLPRRTIYANYPMNTITTANDANVEIKGYRVRFFKTRAHTLTSTSFETRMPMVNLMPKNSAMQVTTVHAMRASRNTKPTARVLPSPP